MIRNKRQRWYSAEGQSRIHTSALEQSSGIRRLASLIILLALILILIQQTSDVKKVETVATAIGLLPNSNSATMAESETQTSEQPSSRKELYDPTNIDPLLLEQMTMEAASPSVAANQQIWKALLRNAPVSVVRGLAHKLYSRQAIEAASESAASQWTEVKRWHADAKLQLDKWADIEAQNAATVVAGQTDVSESRLLPFIDSFQDQNPWFMVSVAREPTTHPDDFFRGLSLALDQKLLEQIVDNSTWWSTDWLPLVRSWQRVGTLRELLANQVALPLHFPKIEVSQLLSAGHDYRGRPIRFEGTIYQVDPSASISEAGFTNLNYEVIWLRPDDTSSQPICVYAPKANIDQNVKLDKDSHISLTGLFFKRIAYKSQRGNEFSPLLLAAYVKPFGSNETLPVANPFQTVNRSTLDSTAWQPPVDTKTPYSIVRPRLQKALAALDDTAIEAGFRGSNASSASKPLLELERLFPELEILLKSRSEWPIAESASLSRFAGIVTKIDRIAIDAESLDVLEQPHVYRCQLEMESTSVTLLCASVPSAWLQTDGTPRNAIRQPCVIDGLRLTRSDNISLVWTRSPKWVLSEKRSSMDASSLEPKIPEPWLFLMGKGWNLAWMDRIQELQKDPIKPLSPNEMEPFFALMQLAKSSPFPVTKSLSKSSSTEKPITEKPITEKPVTEKSVTEKSVTDLLEALRQLKSKAKPALERVSLNMRIVRVSRVHVEDPMQAAILGSTHYYQLDAMADIGNRTYEIKGEKEPIVYHNEYPVTCVAIEVPSWLMPNEPNSDRQAALTRDQVWYPRMKSTASGWFYRFWSYKTQETVQSLGELQRQIGPLIVMDSLSLGFATNNETTPLNTNTKSSNTITVVIGVLGTIGIWWFVRRSMRKPRMRK